jgi:hypothetical protein
MLKEIIFNLNNQKWQVKMWVAFGLGHKQGKVHEDVQHIDLKHNNRFLQFLYIVNGKYIRFR